jgi:hypothetical protein
MVSRSDEVNRFAYVPKDWTDELSSQHNRYRTVAVGWIVTKLGDKIQIVAVSGQNWSARILNALAADELMIVGLKGHAEQLIMEYANQIGAISVAIGAGRNPCVETCQAMAQLLIEKGVLVLLR